MAPVTPAGSVITEFPTAKVEEVNNSKEPEKFVNTIPVAEPEVVNTAPAAEPEVVNTTPAAEPEVVEEPEIVETARTTDEIESIAKAKTGYSDKFIKNMLTIGDSWQLNFLIMKLMNLYLVVY